MYRRFFISTSVGPQKGSVFISTRFSAQLSLSIFIQKYLYECKITYFILENKYLCIYKDSFGAKMKKLVWKFHRHAYA